MEERCTHKCTYTDPSPPHTLGTYLVNEAVKDVRDALADEGAVAHELAVDPVQDGLKVVPLSGSNVA